MCSLAGGYLLSDFFCDNIGPNYEVWLFPLSLAIYFLVLYFIYLDFIHISRLMEGLVLISRLGGRERALLLMQAKRHNREKKEGSEGEEEEEKVEDIFAVPKRIRASINLFKLRYFVIFPSSIVLYLILFASTIYQIFNRQIVAWGPGGLALPSMGAALVAVVCFWVLMPHMPGYVSFKNLIGLGSSEGE